MAEQGGDHGMCSPVPKQDQLCPDLEGGGALRGRGWFTASSSLWDTLLAAREGSHNASVTEALVRQGLLPSCRRGAFSIALPAELSLADEQEMS